MLTRVQYLRYTVVVVLVLVALLGWASHAKADTDLVHVSPSLDNHNALQSRITRKVTNSDEIAVWVAHPDDQDEAEHNLAQLYKGKILILAYGSDLSVRGTDWVPQNWLDETLERVKNVNQGVGDRVIGMVVAIHAYQEIHPKPAPPPPPPPPPGPPPPPPGPAWYDFHWWNWAWGWAPITFGVLFVIWLPLELRRRKRYGRLAKSADEQADWSYDQFVKSTIE